MATTQNETSKRTPTRTIRVEDAVWEKAKAKGAKERDGEKNISDVVRLLLTGYVEGKIKLPKMTLTY